MKKFLTLLLVLTMVLAMLAACGTDSPKADAAESVGALKAKGITAAMLTGEEEVDGQTRCLGDQAACCVGRTEVVSGQDSGIG